MAVQMTSTTTFDQLTDQYRRDKHIGQRPYTDAYLAFDVDENQPVIFELLLPEYATQAHVTSDLLNRASTLKQLRHPNIAQTYQVGQTGTKQPYIATEYVEGYPLAERLTQLERQQASPHSIYALKIVQQIASALVLAERLGIYHSELTPEHVLLKNVTLKSDDSVVLIDLVIPLSAWAASDKLDSQSNPYLSPEQLQNKGIDGRSHIFSLGAILFSLLAGGRALGEPVSGVTYTIRQLTNGQTDLEKVRDNLSSETYALVNKSLQETPARRYRNLEDFLLALDGALAAEELLLHTPKEEIQGKRPWPFFLVPLVLLFLCIALSLLTIRGLPSAALGLDQVNVTDTAVAAIVSSDQTAISQTAAAVSVKETAISEPTATQSSSGTSGSISTPIATNPPTATSIPTETSAPTATPMPTETSQPTETAVQPTATPWPSYRIAVSSASLREGPGIVYTISGYLLEGDTVRIVAQNNGITTWYNVETEDGLLGWISEAVGTAENPVAMADIPIAATIPVRPTSTFTPTPTQTPSPPPTAVPDTGGGDNGGGSTPQPRPTATPPL